jgi:mannose-6-phosphate isomerase-like protein (cupin superfamily)
MGAAPPFDLAQGLRRVVTGVDGQGRSTVVREEVVRGDPRGLLLWAADAPPRAGSAEPPATSGWWPPPGGLRVTLSTRAPDRDASAAPRPEGQPWPDIDDALGFHASASTDVVVMISGRIWLQLDTCEVELKAGDVLIQNGTRHRWRNHAADWPLMAVVIVGAAEAAAHAA